MSARWYQDNLGIKLTPESYNEEPWYQDAGATVFAPFPQDTDYFGTAEQQWMIDLLVRDLDAMVEQLAQRTFMCRWIRSSTRMDGSLVCTIQKEIQSNYGSRNENDERSDLSLCRLRIG